MLKSNSDQEPFISRGGLFTAAPEVPEPEEHPLVSAMRDVQPDDLSPKAALEKMYQLRKLL